MNATDTLTKFRNQTYGPHHARTPMFYNSETDAAKSKA